MKTRAFPDVFTTARRHYEAGNNLARQGRFGDAGTEYERALALNPTFAEAHNNLGNIRKAQGRLDEAIACYKQSATLKPDFAMAHNNLGIALRENAMPQDAEVCHRRALALDPKYAEAYYNLGNALADQHKLNEAIGCYETSIELKPDFADAYLNLGNALRQVGSLQDAVDCYRRATIIKPHYAEAYHNLGNALLEQSAPEEAAICYQRALVLKPDYAEAHMDLGNALLEQGKVEEAMAFYRRAAAVKPDYAEAHMNIGYAYRCMGDLTAAMESCRHAALLKPDFAEAHMNEAMFLLLSGEFAPGWRKYEWRWRIKNAKPHGITAPMWNGEDLQGNSILLHCEQGLGDSIQFVRYARLVKDRGGQVLLSCPKSLARLFENVSGIDGIYPEGANLPDYTCHAPLLSLPMLFSTTLETIPLSIPYITASRNQTEVWGARLQSFAGLKVGLVWSGNPVMGQRPAHATDRRRSMRLDQFAPLAAVSGVRLLSLQKGAAAEKARKPPMGMTIIDLMNDVEDFADTAALIANLDLVIGVDTSVIHLAGAMGKPVWVLSRFDGCWRWLAHGELSPWYPSLRLFRQPQMGDWQSVVEDVGAALSQKSAEAV